MRRNLTMSKTMRPKNHRKWLEIMNWNKTAPSPFARNFLSTTINASINCHQWILWIEKKAGDNQPNDILRGPRCALTVKMWIIFKEEKMLAVAKAHSEINVGSHSSHSRRDMRRPRCRICGLRISASTWEQTFFFYKTKVNQFVISKT